LNPCRRPASAEQPKSFFPIGIALTKNETGESIHSLRKYLAAEMDRDVTDAKG
jgi:hypothetical protein